MFARSFLSLILLTLAFAPAALAHDPSAWGGLYRSRDNGETWFPADAGLFIGGAIALAIDPNDANHLLYGTDTRLLRSKNGGRDWVQEPGAQFAGPVYAAFFDGRRKAAVVSSASRVFFSANGSAWIDSMAPAGAAPARAIVAGTRQLYLAGEQGVFVSEDGGREWRRAGDSLPEGVAASVVVLPGSRETVLALVDGVVWASTDEGATWKRREVGTPPARVDALASDGGLWAAAQDRIFASLDEGASWAPAGNPLPERDTTIRGIAAADAGHTILLTTHRGVIRSRDAGKTWSMVESTLPVHLEAGPLARDPHDGVTLYAGFSLTPYNEIWRRAAGGANLIARLDPVSLAGAAAFLVLLIVLASLGVRWLLRARA